VILDERPDLLIGWPLETIPPEALAAAARIESRAEPE